MTTQITKDLILKEYEYKRIKLKDKIKSLDAGQIKKLKESLSIDIQTLQSVITHNSVNSLYKDYGLDLSLFLYEEFKHYDSLEIYKQIVLLQLIPIIITKK